MNLRTGIALIHFWVVPLLCFNLCWGQFQFFGLELSGESSIKSMKSANLSLSYLRQFSAKHGWGAELSLPRSIPTDLAGEIKWDAGTPWEGTASWTRIQLPSVGFRYRFFVGNNFFMGTNLQLGAVREKCFIDRSYMESYDGYEILPIYYDYSLTSPHLRLSAEMGLHWPMGKWLFGSILIRGGPQFTISRVSSLGTITYKVRSQVLDSYHGIDVYGNAAFCLGVKL